MKKYIPKSLFGRFLLILIIPNIITQIFTIYIFYERHWDEIYKRMANSLSGEISFIAQNFENITIEKKLQDMVHSASKYLSLNLELTNKIFDNNDINNNQPNFIKNFNDILSENLNIPYKSYYSKAENIIIYLWLNNNKEQYLKITASKKRLANPSTYIFVMWLIGIAILFLIIAIIFMKNQIKSINKLALSAEKFGKGQNIDDFRPSGSKEIKLLGKAFTNMKRRIDRHVKQRTKMLASISHDLKTPITRIRLQLAIMEKNADIIELENEVIILEEIIKEFLDFAKENKKQVISPINVSDILRSIISTYKEDQNKLQLNIKAGIIIQANPNYFRRVINNIIDNSLKYANNIKITANSSDKYFTIFIDDDGPGIPVKKRKIVFKPFYRIDNSRNQDIAGSGLGLAIAKDIIMGYGGKIQLYDSPMGGLRVTIIIPI